MKAKPAHNPRAHGGLPTVAPFRAWRGLVAPTSPEDSGPAPVDWRRGWDLNPRSTFWADTRFPVVHLRPLGHLSSTNFEFHFGRTARLACPPRPLAEAQAPASRPDAGAGIPAVEGEWVFYLRARRAAKGYGPGGPGGSAPAGGPETPRISCPLPAPRVGGERLREGAAALRGAGRPPVAAPRARGSRRGAESEGFEPPVPLPVHLISSQAPSTNSASSPRADLPDFPRGAKRQPDAPGAAL